MYFDRKGITEDFVAALLPLISAEGSNECNNERLFRFKSCIITQFFTIASGIYMFYGCNWARWLLVIWLAFHVIVSIQDSTLKLLVHSLLFVVVMFFLFRAPSISLFFKRGD